MVLFKISAIKGIIGDLQKFIDSDTMDGERKNNIIIAALGQINDISSLESINGKPETSRTTKVDQGRKTRRTKKQGQTAK